MSIDFSMTAGDLVKRAMQARRALALSRSPTAAELEYGLERLNQLLKTLGGDGVTPWTDEQGTATITANTAEVVLSPRPADVLSVALETSATFNRPLARWEAGQYAELVNPASSGEPTLYSLRDTGSEVYLRVWPVPTADRTINYRYSRVIDDVTGDAALDMPQAWLEGIEAMLAIRLTAFANGNPDLPALAMMHERRLYDWSRPDTYTFEPAGYCG